MKLKSFFLKFTAFLTLGCFLFTNTFAYSGESVTFEYIKSNFFHLNGRAFMNGDPDLSNVRGDERFKELVKMMQDSRG